MPASSASAVQAGLALQSVQPRGNSEAVVMLTGARPASVLAWLDAPARADALTRRFTDLHHLLRRDTARTATDAIAQVLAAA